MAAKENSTQLIELFCEELITNDTQLLPIQSFRDDVRKHFVAQLLRQFESAFNEKTKLEMETELRSKIITRHQNSANNEETKHEMIPEKLKDLLLKEYRKGIRAINGAVKTKLSELHVSD